jgi:sugar/nucleoside kinase (ribokinase family)
VNGEQTVAAVGVHVVDVLVRPVSEIPAGQGGQLVEEIRITAAGSAGGTALTLAKLGARVRSVGAVGDDALGEVLLGLLGDRGIDTRHLVRRKGIQTSASVLPIRPDGSRPAFHVVGANGTLTAADVPVAELAAAGVTHLHFGAPEFMGGEEAAKILRAARERGIVTSADLLAPGEQAAAIRDWVGPALPHLDLLLPNEEQVLGLSGAGDVLSGARALLELGIGCVAATCGADGAVVLEAGGEPHHVPAFATEVVDTTGCGDAFSAGLLRGLALGRTPAEAAVLGCAAAALVAAGLGSDHGDFDLDAAERFAASQPTLSSRPKGL